MNKRASYLIEGITKDIIAYIMEDEGVDLSTAIIQFHNSETFTKLSDENTGLYIESSAYVYEIFKDEMKYGRLRQVVLSRLLTPPFAMARGGVFCRYK